MPVFIVDIFRVRSVVSTAETAHVIADSDEIVFRVGLLVCVEHELRQIEICQWTIDEKIDLVAVVTRVVESFQLDDEDLRQEPQVDLLRSFLQHFARGTEPEIVVGQNLLVGEVLEAIGQRGSRFLRCLDTGAVRSETISFVSLVLLELLADVEEARSDIDDQRCGRCFEIDWFAKHRGDLLRRLPVVLIEDARGSVQRLI